MAEILLRKKGVEISGVCDMHPDWVGKSLFSVLRFESDGGFRQSGHRTAGDCGGDPVDRRALYSNDRRDAIY